MDKRTGDHTVVYAARPLSNELVAQESEVVEVAYFDPQSLPEPFTWWDRRRISDALESVTGTSCLQDRVWTLDPDMTYQEMAELRNREGLSRSAFFEKYRTSMGELGEREEVRPARVTE